MLMMVEGSLMFQTFRSRIEEVGKSKNGHSQLNTRMYFGGFSAQQSHYTAVIWQGISLYGLVTCFWWFSVFNSGFI